MQIVRSASFAGMLSRSAVEAARTVSMLSLRQVRMMRTAISPRLAIRMRRSANWLTCFAHAQECFAVLGERAVGDQYFAHRAANAGTHRIHQLHDFDDGHDCSLFHLRPDFHERRRAWLGSTIERAQQG